MVKIFHSPKCGTSRNTLALIRNLGVEREVVLYLETPQKWFDEFEQRDKWKLWL